MKYVCKICGFIYDEATQDAKWNDLDTDWVCPVCKAPKEKFEAVAETSTSKYAGTKTEKNLMEAFAGESMARNKYTFFAEAARKEGLEQIAAMKKQLIKKNNMLKCGLPHFMELEQLMKI